MVSEKEKIGIRRFVKSQLRDELDLSTLTLGMLKKQYLAEAGCESLSSEAKKFMKQVVEEELLKMQENDDSESEPELKKPEKKRKRDKEREELESEDETESRAKKSRQSGSSSDSEDEQNCEAGRRSKEQIGSRPRNKKTTKESVGRKNKKAESRITSDGSSDEERNESAKGGKESPSPEERVDKKADNAKNGETRGVKTSEGIKNRSSDEESECNADSKSEKSDKISDWDSAANEKEKNVMKKNDSDSDSSSLPSLEEETKSSPKNTKEQKQKKEKKTKTDEKNRGPKDENKAVVRLKRYIALCGVRRNYKKLLDGCRSTKSKVAVLKKELEDLGVHGNPSIEKCKKIRLKREEAQELAELDVDNIIPTEGRPKRRGTSAMQIHTASPSYQRALNSDSDSDQKNDAHKGRRKISEWSNLHGIISDDADTD